MQGLESTGSGVGLLGLCRGSWEAPGGGRRQPQLCWHNHVLAAGCNRATSTLLPPRHRPAPRRQLVGGRKTGGRDWRDSILWWQRWAAAAGRDPEQPRLLPASVGGTSPPGKHPAAHSAQASEDTQAAAVQNRGRGGRKTSGTRALDLVRLSAAASLWRLPVPAAVRLEQPQLPVACCRNRSPR